MGNAEKILLDQVSNNIGIILNSILGHIETEKLLQFLKTQDEALNEHALISITDVNGKITYANEKNVIFQVRFLMS